MTALFFHFLKNIKTLANFKGRCGIIAARGD